MKGYKLYIANLFSKGKAIYGASILILIISLAGLGYATSQQSDVTKISAPNLLVFDRNYTVPALTTSSFSINGTAEGITSDFTFYGFNLLKSNQAENVVHIIDQYVDYENGNYTFVLQNDDVSARNVTMRFILLGAML